MQANLNYARSLCRSQIAPSGKRALLDALLGWHDRTPLRWRFTAFLICNVPFWVALLLNMLRPVAGWRIGAYALAAGWMILGTSITAELTGMGRRIEGVVLADQVIVRKGNGVGFELQFEHPIKNGVEFLFLERRGDWLNIQLVNGEEGWIEARDAEFVP